MPQNPLRSLGVVSLSCVTSAALLTGCGRESASTGTTANPSSEIVNAVIEHEYEQHRSRSSRFSAPPVESACDKTQRAEPDENAVLPPVSSDIPPLPIESPAVEPQMPMPSSQTNETQQLGKQSAGRGTSNGPMPNVPVPQPIDPFVREVAQAWRRSEREHRQRGLQLELLVERQRRLILEQNSERWLKQLKESTEAAAQINAGLNAFEHARKELEQRESRLSQQLTDLQQILPPSTSDIADSRLPLRD